MWCIFGERALKQPTTVRTTWPIKFSLHLPRCFRNSIQFTTTWWFYYPPWGTRKEKSFNPGSGSCWNHGCQDPLRSRHHRFSRIGGSRLHRWPNEVSAFCWYEDRIQANWIHFAEEHGVNPLLPLQEKYNLKGRLSNYSDFCMRWVS